MELLVFAAHHVAACTKLERVEHRIFIQRHPEKQDLAAFRSALHTVLKGTESTRVRGPR
jgi:hypothetical protein